MSTQLAQLARLFEDRVRLLSSIVEDLIVKLDRRSPEMVPQAVCGDFSGFVSTECAGF